MATNSKTFETIRKSGGEVQNALRKDLSELRDETSHLGESLLHAGSEQLQHTKETLQNKLNTIEEFVKEKPGQSVAIAFAAGLLASLILGRR